jgi:predicted acyltransferase
MNPVATSRVFSIDAYRGFTMLAMISGGMGLGKLLKDPNWGWLADQFTHREWVGCTFWDLIQPSFMFLVGVSMPVAFGLRMDRGETWAVQLQHAFKRAFLLILLGVLLDSMSKPEPIVQFIRVLQQIALGYIIAFFTLTLSWKKQLLVAVGCLLLHTALHLLFGYYKGAGYDPWERDKNIGYILDSHLSHFFTSLGYPTVFPNSTGGYATLNALSASATIIFGCMIGRMFREQWEVKVQIKTLVLAGLAGLALGWGLSFPIPMVKKIWTASFGLFAAGWTCLIFAFFHSLTEGLGKKAWANPFMIAGMNSIFLYMSAGILTGQFRNLLMPFTSHALTGLGNWGPVLLALLVICCHWSLAYWLYRRKIFFKV